MSTIILPDARMKTPTGLVMGPMGWMERIFCSLCGKEGGLVPQENMTYVSWLCDGCFATHGQLTCLAVIPDEIFFKEVEQAQLEKYGRPLDPIETELQLANPDSLESLLARSRAGLTPHASQ